MEADLVLQDLLAILDTVDDIPAVGLHKHGQLLGVVVIMVVVVDEEEGAGLPGRQAAGSQHAWPEVAARIVVGAAPPHAGARP